MLSMRSELPLLHYIFSNQLTQWQRISHQKISCCVGILVINVLLGYLQIPDRPKSDSEEEGGSDDVEMAEPPTPARGRKLTRCVLIVPAGHVRY